MIVKNFWEELPRPFFALAPMADVTDAAFRRLIAKYSKVPGSVAFVTYTEFVSADGLALAGQEGKSKLMRDLLYSEAERPIVAQFFTSTPEHMEAAARLAQDLGFDGVDINMGCPDKSIEKQGAGAVMIKNPARAAEVIAAAKRGAPNIPISIKTRLGYNKDVLEEWLPTLLQAEPATIIVHARTRKEMSKVPARWERVKRAMEIRDELNSKTLIVGNGDIADLGDAREKALAAGADGAMLGRAIFGNPWLFAPAQANEAKEEHGEKSLASPYPLAVAGERGEPRTFRSHVPPELSTRLKVAVEHTKLFEELLGDIKSFAIMKKHFKAYCEGFPGAKELRMELMETNTAAEVEKIIEKFLGR